MSEKKCYIPVECEVCGSLELDVLFNGIADTPHTDYPLTKEVTQYKLLIVEHGRYFNGKWVKTYDVIPFPVVSPNEAEYCKFLHCGNIADSLHRWLISWHFPRSMVLHCDDIQKCESQSTGVSCSNENTAILKIYGIK